MKRYFPAEFAIVIFFLVCTSAVSKAAAPVVLADNSQSKWHIVTLSNNQQVQFAGSELQKYLAQISDVKLPVGKVVKNNYNIIIGLRRSMPAKYASLLGAPKKGYDGYSITIKPGIIVIAGDDGPGVIYGVYDLLEHIGCRWFYLTQDPNDPEVVPHLKTLSLNTACWGVASPIQYRICNDDEWFFSMNYPISIKQADWAMKNRYNMMGWQPLSSNQKKSDMEQYQELDSAGVTAELKKRGMFIHGPAHSFDQFLSTDKYFTKHPEWFGMRNGKRVPQSYIGAQFCWSNADARKEFIKNASEFAKAAPLIKIFCSVPFDGGVPCDCDNCKKAGASNLLMLLENEMIAVFKVNNPGVMVETIGGYGAVPDPPSDLSIINPKQRIVWAQWGRYHGVGYDDPTYDRRNLDGWRKAAKGGLTICNYYCDNFAEPWVMGPFTTAIKSDRDYFLKNNVSALYVLMYPKGYWWNHSLNGYLAGRAYYDVSIDPYKEIDDYALHYYGKDAGPFIAAYYDQWATDIDLSYRVRGDSRPEDRAMLAEQRKKWIEPAIAAAKNDPLFAYRVNKVAKLHKLAETITEGHRLQDVIDLLRSQGKFDDAAKVLDKARAHADKIMAMFYELADLKQGLIERNEVGGFIKLGITNWLNDEAKLIAANDKSLRNGAKKLSETEMLPTDVTK